MTHKNQHPRISLVDYEIICAAGSNTHELKQALETQTSGLRKNDFPDSNLNTWIGRVPAIDDFNWNSTNKIWQSRNNALAAIGWENNRLQDKIQRLIKTYGAERIAVIMGSSTSSIDRTELAYRSLEENKLAPEFNQENVLNPHGPGLFVSYMTGITGPTITVNTACSSSAKVFATAARWLELGIIDAALVGGVDTLCLSVLHGFHSLQLVSEHPCRPFDDKRDGINLGEAAGFAILTREEAEIDKTEFTLTGYGESSDAHHMSHPHPEGLGARSAIQSALNRAKLEPQDIDYINLHGTASRANDLIEGCLISELFPLSTKVSSSKGWTGHTLGAAGITEIIVALEAAKTNVVPATMNLENLDKDIPPISISAGRQEKTLNHVMNNSFGFGGNNACLIFSKEASNV